LLPQAGIDDLIGQQTSVFFRTQIAKAGQTNRMKLNVVLPWILVVGLSAGFAAVYVKGSAKNAELAQLRQTSKEVEQLRADLAAEQEKNQLSDDQVLMSRKDKEELLRLRGEVGKLRTDTAQKAKELQLLQSRAESAKAQAADALREASSMKTKMAETLNASQQQATDAQNRCINNLRQLDGAKQQWALENNKTAADIPQPQEIAAFLHNSQLPLCPSGGIYTLNNVGQPPTCSIAGHALATQ
jgi:hypothetical protein